MPFWSDLGHAVRRRSGAPMSHHESVGKTVSKDTPSPEQLIAGSARAYMGLSAMSAGAAPALTGKLIPKKNRQAADPTAGGKANRKNVPAGNATQSERMGARYSVGAKLPGVHSIEAGATMANAKTVPSVAGKNSPNFQSGMGSSY